MTGKELYLKLSEMSEEDLNKEVELMSMCDGRLGGEVVTHIEVQATHIRIYDY